MTRRSMSGIGPSTGAATRMNRKLAPQIAPRRTSRRRSNADTHAILCVMRYFHEEQRFARSWSWLLVLLVVVALVTVATAGLSPRPTPAAAIAAAAVVLAVAFVVLFLARLETEVTAGDPLIRFPGPRPTPRVTPAHPVASAARGPPTLEPG